MKTKINQIDKSKIWERCYLLVLAIYLLRQILLTTMFQLAWPWYSDQLLRLAIFGVILLKTGYEAKEEGTSWFWCVVAAMLYSVSSISNGYTFLYDTSLLFIGAKNISYKKILKIYVWCTVIVMAAAILGSMTGCITDLIYKENAENYRHSFGIVYTTDFAAHLVYLVLAVWVAYDHIPSAILSVISLIVAGVAFYFCYAKCGTIVTILAAVGMLYVFATGYFAKKSSKISTVLQNVDRILIFVMPVCMIIMCILMVRYDASNPLMSKINSIISGRLQLATSAYEKYGIKLFGTAFDMIGGGTSTISQGGYNFVDTSYCMILLRYGIPTLLTLTVLTVKTAWNAKKHHNERLIMALAIVAVHSTIEHHMIELAYNIFLLLPFAKLGYLRSEDENLDEINSILSRKTIFSCVYYAIITVGTCLLLPLAVSYGKTIVSLLGLYESWRHKYFIAAVVFVLVIYIAFVETFRSCLLTRLVKNKLTKKQMCLFFGETAVLMCILLGSKCIIRLEAGKVQDTIVAGTEVIDYLSSSEEFDGKIYVDDYPIIYSEKTGAVSHSILTGESKCTEENAVIITGHDSELNRLIQNGFSFGLISGEEYVYTNSSEAVELLKQHGIDMTSYFSLFKEEDLESLAVANDLTCTEDGNLLIEGKDHSLIHGSGVSIYRGKLRVEYKIKLLETSIESGTVAKARISSYWGKNICTEQEITRDMFDENGECTYVAELDMGDASSMEFLLFASGDTKLEVEEIRYGKVG